MAIAIIHRMPEGFSTDQYDAVNEKAQISSDPPEGLIHHTLGGADGSYVILDVWESRDAFESFRNDRLNPTLEEIVGSEAFAQMPEPQREFFEVHSTVNA